MYGLAIDNHQPDLFNVMDSVKINQRLKRAKEEQREQEAENRRKARNEAIGLQITENRKYITNLFYFPNPKGDNEQLFNYQYEYLKNNSSEAWGKLMALSYVVIKRQIRGYMSKHKIRLTKEEQDDRTSEAALYVLRRFDPCYITTLGKKEKKNFLDRFPYGQYYCTTNFIDTLGFGVKHVFKYTTKLEKNTVYLEDYFEGDKK